MPRPGPRPYECVRRAWHSDRHQPIRGSFIQEIFRLVSEVHSSKTRKNKEWQEKLPIVVLRAEEIMYSKANSEAEYMDLKTLWDRTNDAINTIIRRDESTETGNLLQPCIEAALNLGCIARRASRSQRNSISRCYLSSCTQEPNTCSASDKPIFMNPAIANTTHSGSRSEIHVCHTANVASHKFIFDKVPLPKENNPSSSSWKVYHLHYGSCRETSKCVPNSTDIAKDDAVGVNGHGNETGCDLSLRLGSSSPTLPGKLESAMPQMVKEFPFFNGFGVNQPLSKLTKDQKIHDYVKKRKALFSDLVEDCPLRD